MMLKVLPSIKLIVILILMFCFGLVIGRKTCFIHNMVPFSFAAFVESELRDWVELEHEKLIQDS